MSQTPTGRPLRFPVRFAPGPAPGNIAITTPRRATLLAEAEARLAAGQGFAIATLNLDHVVKLERDADFRAAYLAQSHVVADGNPIIWLSRMAGNEAVELVPGSELITPLSAIAARIGAPVGLFGSREETLALAGQRLEAAHPGLRVAAAIAPPMGFEPAGPEADRLLDTLAASGARLVFLALGAPKQEILAARGRARHPQIGFVSIGAGLDFIAGAQNRAPVWVQRIAMEWFWRMSRNPGRLARRYGECFAILPGLMTQARRERART
ncbi:MAG: WecB/TagA/CpsF family glycosyltransferase [Defluviimonas sp.]|nr:WecB/TagA/CpsF family glycosyltransferase [Defluviimonas sp.]